MRLIPRALAGLLIGVTAMCLPAIGQTPIAGTPYGLALFRFEGRTASPEMDSAKRRSAESALASAGMQARWIQMVDHHGSPLLDTPSLPGPGASVGAANEAALKAWVAEVHARGMAAMSWYPLTFCEAAYDVHPDWRQQFIEPYPVPAEQRIYCCINSGYGDALIKYCVEGVRRLNLDGIWFDGSVWTGIWQRPYPLSCCCEACRKRFRRDTGKEIPSKLDWNDPVCRTWVAWRFRVFGAYIGRLSAAIRAAKPGAAVVINHYHRPGIPWRSAVPLDRYAADIISGSEAAGDDLVDLTARLCRAYGRTQAEVWRAFDLPGEPSANAEPLLHHALSCFAAGAVPAYGGDPFNPKTAPTAALLSPVIAKVGRLAGGRSVASVALHVSQQTETFFYARGDSPGSASTPYWTSLSAWTSALGAVGLSPDYVYDADFRPAVLARYRAVLMPLSIGLKGAQARAALQYARKGGVLMLGIGAGQADGEGQPTQTNELAGALGFSMAGAPRPDGSDAATMVLRPAAGGASFVHQGIRCPVMLTSSAWRPSLVCGTGRTATPCLAERAYGKGRVILLNTDSARTWGRQFVTGGKTKLTYVRRSARDWALEFVDDAVAPATHYPDVETNLPAFGAPRYAGGALDFDARIGEAAHAQIELRSTSGPLEGPIVALGPGGKLLADGQAVCDAPVGQWFHVRIMFDFATEGRPAAYTMTVTLPDGSRPSVRRPTANPAFHALDWFVMYGPATSRGVFALDNVVLTRRPVHGPDETAVRYDFEEGPTGRDRPTLVQTVTQLLAKRVMQPVRVKTTGDVRSGVFAVQAGKVRVHLHNRTGMRADFASTSGPSASIVTEYAVKSARCLVTGRSVPVVRRGTGSVIGPIRVGLYEVVELGR